MLQNPSAPPEISVVIPFYNESESLGELLPALLHTLTSLERSFEVILVDDGSTDNSASVAQDFIRSSPAFSLIVLRRNFGKSEALAAGFAHSKGKIIITLDADLQDDPADIQNFLQKIDSGADLVCGWRKFRRDPITKRVQSRLYNFLLRLFRLGVVHDINCPFRCFRREVIAETSLHGEHHRLVPLAAKWHGFTVAEIQTNHRPRKYGKSKYTAARIPNAGLDILNALLLRRFYRNPGRLFGSIGAVLTVAGFIICLYLAYLRIRYGTIDWRYPLLVLGVLLLALGAQSVLTGFLCELVIRTRTTTKSEYSIRRIVTHSNDPGKK
jgi:glycosyltransferase involved in cell wall biosynthesis